MKCFTNALILTLALAAMSTGVTAQVQEKLALRAGKVLTMNKKDEVLNNVIVFVNDGKIEKIVPAKGAEIPAGYREVDHSDHWLLPGFIDPHNHTSTNQRRDINDYGYLTNPGLVIGDMIQVDTATNRRALAGGVTTVLLIPGSGVNMSGFGALARLGARTQEEAIMRSPGSLKIAQAGNPERWYFSPQRSYMNYNLRQSLTKARAYHQDWNDFESGKTKTKPEISAEWDNFRLLFQNKIPASVHTQMFQVVSKSMTLLHDEFGISTMVDHGTFDAYKAGALAVERGVYVMAGPRVWWQDGDDGTINSCAGAWYDRGVRRLGLNTDAGVLPQENLSLQGTVSVKYGWRTYPALVGMTRYAAESLHVADRIGSLVAGKDADIVAWSGNPLDLRAGVEVVYTLGFVSYDASTGVRRY